MVIRVEFKIYEVAHLSGDVGRGKGKHSIGSYSDLMSDGLRSRRGSFRSISKTE